jgi:hypothetical protein
MQPNQSNSNQSPANAQEPPSPQLPLKELVKSDAPQTQNQPYTSGQLKPAYENIYTEICTEIVKAQANILGLEVALEQANSVNGLSIDPKSLHSTVSGDGSQVINDLIEKYRVFFGSAAVAVCREAAARLLTGLSQEQTPALLSPPIL